MWLFHWLNGNSDHIESAQWDCFPSGHTERPSHADGDLARSLDPVSRNVRLHSGVIFATVYLRYHYRLMYWLALSWRDHPVLTAPRVYSALGGDPEP
jgi:hypothetical protein